GTILYMVGINALNVGHVLGEGVANRQRVLWKGFIDGFDLINMDAGHTIFLLTSFFFLSQEFCMSVPFNALSKDFAVAPQLTAEDMQAVADAGFKSVIINRPDFEGGPDQPSSAEVMNAARVAGLNIEYQPVVSGAMTQD